MIKITKPLQAPAILQTRGRAKRDDHCADYLQDNAAFDAGKRLFAFDATIYGDATVKQALILAQHGKCCFCERKIGDDGDVEHFRPKAGCRQDSKSRLLRPGYYWLAYDWENLLLSCSACNQRHKRNLFPLEDPAKRVRSHTGDLTQETPLFLNPAQQDPEERISFRKEIPYAIDGNSCGKTTIKALGLDREALNEPRRDRLNTLLAMRDIIRIAERNPTEEGREIIVKAQAYLTQAVSDGAEFAAMARAAAKLDFDFTLP